MQIENILIIQTAFIGDVILATPILEKLHLQFPKAKIDFLLRKGNEGLFENHPFLNEVIVWDKKSEKYLNLFRILLKIRGKKYDLVINLQRFASTGFLCGLSKAKLKIGFSENPLSFLFHKKINYGFQMDKINRHEVERCHALIREITDDVPAKMKLYPDKKAFDRVKTFKEKKYVVICPASVWFTKQLPAEKWVEFINQVNVKLDVYLLGGKDDEDLCQNILNQNRNHSVRNLAGKLSFLETAALMVDAEMCYVNDSGPMHIASAMNAPTTAIFLSTVPRFGFGPRSDNSQIIETANQLDCRPCGIHGHQQCPKGHFKCAEVDIPKLPLKTEI